jgi:hypothetical protein
MQNPIEQTVVVLSNAIALTSAVMVEVAGTEIGETVNGSFAGRDLFDQFFTSHMARRLPEFAPVITPQA